MLLFEVQIKEGPMMLMMMMKVSASLDEHRTSSHVLGSLLLSLLSRSVLELSIQAAATTSTLSVRRSRFSRSGMIPVVSTSEFCVIATIASCLWHVHNGEYYNYAKSSITSSRCWQWPASTTTTAKHATTIKQRKAGHRRYGVQC